MSKKALPNPYPTVPEPKRSRTPENFPKMKHRARRRERVDHLGSVHVSIVPVTHTFDSLVKRAMESVRHIALGFEDVGSAADRAGSALDEVAPNLPNGAVPNGFLMDEAFREDVNTAYTLYSPPASLPKRLPTAVLNPNVRKRR